MPKTLKLILNFAEALSSFRGEPYLISKIYAENGTEAKYKSQDNKLAIKFEFVSQNRNVYQ